MKEETELKEYFSVKAKCGHVGMGKCIYIVFPVIAESGREAAARVRKFGRVKHDHKDAIAEVNRISYSEYILLKTENERDLYLHCRNIQEQRMIPNLDERIQEDQNMRVFGKGKIKFSREYRYKRARILERDFIRQLEEMQESVVGAI